MTLFLLAAAPPPQGPSPLLQLVPYFLIFLVFYFLIIHPTRKAEKERETALAELREGLKKGDRVVTNGGLYGEVVKADGKIVVLKLADNVKVRIARTAIAGPEVPEDDKKGN